MRLPLWARPVLDIGMTLLLLLLMSYQIMSQDLHAILGTMFLLVLILHSFLNRRWYTALGRGRYTPSRLIAHLVNLLLPALFLLTIGSGLIMVHSSIPMLRAWIAPARSLHLLLSHWVFLLAAIHLGLHGRMVTSRLKQKLSKNRFTLAAFLAYGLAAFGIWAFYDLRMADYLFRQSLFAFFDVRTPAPVVLLKYASIFILFAVLAHKGYTWIQKVERMIVQN